MTRSHNSDDSETGVDSESRHCISAKGRRNGAFRLDLSLKSPGKTGCQSVLEKVSGSALH